jgi:dienelactone hydrolase
MEHRIHASGLSAVFRAPDASGPFPAVLALGGSDGGTPEYFLDLLVPEGFACLALTYWGTRETKLAFTDIPLELVERGLRWLSDDSRVVVKNGRVGLIGASRGGELALLAAAAYPNLVGPVVAYTPSSVAWVGIDMSLPEGTTRSSWTHNGQPLPYVPFPPGAAPVKTDRGLSLLPMCEAGLADAAAVQRAAIAVERATGPLLLVSGGDDGVWPTGRMCEQLVERMARHGRQGEVTHLHYPSAGHMLFPYKRPSDTLIPALPADLGGNPAADAAAHRAAWPAVVAHLRQR